jgi:HEAT repeat protein
MWPQYLGEHSGLPGPRANLTLVNAVATIAKASTVESLIADGGEYQMMCAAAALGALADDPACEDAARSLAADARWRVREGAAIGLQHLGDRTFEALEPIVRRWVDDPSPLVQRAALAAICEPRLLLTPEAASVAVDICSLATQRLAALSEGHRSSPDARTLRKALGYCWSVAIAADSGRGLPAFQRLDTSHPDTAWIVAENRRKKRISALL